MVSLRVLFLIIAHLSSVVCILSLLSLFAHLLSRVRDWLLDEVCCREEEKEQEDPVEKLIGSDEERGN